MISGRVQREPTAESAMVKIPPGAYKQRIDDDLHAQWKRTAKEPERLRLWYR